MYDVIIVGGGIAGLSAAINAASEGLKTCIIDGQTRFGGQAGTSTLIENFIGFPQGISGDDLIKHTLTQAAKFGVEFFAPFNVINIQKDYVASVFSVWSDENELLTGKTVVLATGVVYRADHIKNLSRFVNFGVYYQSPSVRQKYTDKNICVVGGANSAGQAACFLAGNKDCNITLIIRGNALEDKMSYYLCDRLKNLKNIDVRTNCTITECNGYECLESLKVEATVPAKDIYSKATILCDRLFVLIGATPKTQWLKDLVKLDDKNFVVAGNLGYVTQTLTSGLFAAGDIVSGSIKRVSSAAGSGASCIPDIHNYLKTLK